MPATDFAEDAKIMPNGRVTIPKSILTILGVKTGDSETVLTEGNMVRIYNSSAYALMHLQR